MANSKSGSFQHDASAIGCDPELSSKLKSAAYTAAKRISGEDPDNVPILMSGAGHDAMAMSHLTKVLLVSTSYFQMCIYFDRIFPLFDCLNCFYRWQCYSCVVVVV